MEIDEYQKFNAIVATLESIIQWWEDDHDFPYGGAKVDPAEACQWYKRRMILMADAARTTLEMIKKERLP